MLFIHCRFSLPGFVEKGLHLESEKSKSRKNLIIGILSSIGILFIIGAIIFVIYKRRKGKISAHDNKNAFGELINSNSLNTNCFVIFTNVTKESAQYNQSELKIIPTNSEKFKILIENNLSESTINKGFADDKSVKPLHECRLPPKAKMLINFKLVNKSEFCLVRKNQSFKETTIKFITEKYSEDRQVLYNKQSAIMYLLAKNKELANQNKKNGTVIDFVVSSFGQIVNCLAPGVE